MLLAATLLSAALFTTCSKTQKHEVVNHVAKSMYHCPMHPQIISDKPASCPICGMSLVVIDKGDESGGEDSLSSGVDLSNNAVRIDPVTVQNMGVVTQRVEMRAMTLEVRAGASVAINETRQTIISTKVMGWVEKLMVDYTGVQVHKGQALFTLYSPDLVSTQEEYLGAFRFASNQKSNDASGAQQLLESTRRRLANWDITPDQIAALEQRQSVERTLSIFAPANGIVLEKNIVVGQNIMPGAVLYRIADLSSVWVIANIYPGDIALVKTGMSADIELATQPGMIFSGTVQYVSPTLDPVSKTAQVRVEVRNTSDFAIKPEMFATVVIKSPIADLALAVSEQAVIHTGTRTLVIVDLGKGYFAPQEVRIGQSANGYVQILKGLTEGQSIVTSSQFLIDSESNLMAAIGQMSGRP